MVKYFYLLYFIIKKKIKTFLYDKNKKNLCKLKFIQINNDIVNSKNQNELSKKLKKYIPDEKVNEYFSELIFNYNKYKKLKILNRSKFLYSRKNIYYTILFYRFFLYKGWLSQSYQFGKFINKQKNYELNASLRKKNSDKNFYKFISNKKVAIIGPSKTNSKNGEEIDKYDVVIRMGQIDSSSLSKKIKGLKTDIIYFNGDKTFDLIKKKKIDDVKKAKFLVFKSIGFVKLFKKVGLNNVRKASETDRFFRVGFSFGLPWIIHDVIKCNPKSIKIFDTDFLINPIRVKNYYQGGLKPKNYFLKILLQHDPISQFEFMKKLLKKYKIIHGDKNFNSIIKMSAQKYLSKLEYNYNLK